MSKNELRMFDYFLDISLILLMDNHRKLFHLYFTSSIIFLSDYYKNVLVTSPWLWRETMSRATHNRKPLIGSLFTVSEVRSLSSWQGAWCWRGGWQFYILICRKTLGLEWAFETSKLTPSDINLQQGHNS